MTDESFRRLCLYNVLDGLREGLTHFSGPSRAALVYAENPEDPMRVYDPQNLLQGHEPKLKELYLDSWEWRANGFHAGDMEFYGKTYPEENLGLAGLISYGARTPSIFYQMWFTEHHPDMCATGPTEKWLEHAAFLLSHDFAYQDTSYTRTSGSILREYATQAVHDHLTDRLNLTLGWDAQIYVYPLLDAILGISKTPEEGAWPRGNLVFIDPRSLSDLEFLIRFPTHERPSFKNFKHVRKLLLAVEDTNLKLISDGKSIVGIASNRMPECRITADFMGGHGFLRLAGNLVCSFSDGSFHSSNRRPKLVHLEEALLESGADPHTRHMLFQILSSIVHRACLQKHGCTLVVELNPQPTEMSGQRLEKPVDLREERFLDLAKSVSKVDGALHIGADGRLHAFACLLDGRTVPGEDRARGARFNSALRFTAEHENIIVVVVSSDKPVSVIQGGVELSAQCEWSPFSELGQLPPTLEQWLEADPDEAA